MSTVYRNRLAAAHGAALGLFIAMALAPSTARGQALALVPRCVGCVEDPEDPTVNLLLRDDSTQGVTIEWECATDPGGTPITLYAGNPSDQVTIPSRAVFGRDQANERRRWKRGADGKWRIAYAFRGDELGKGTFLTVLVAPGKDVDRIQDWRAWRLMTLEEKQQLEAPPERPPGTSVRITPWLLQVDTNHGLLPPRSGDVLAWYSVAPLEGNVTDVDLDGANTGVPGLGIQVAEPWHTSAGERWQDKLRSVVTGSPGHKVRFEDFAWIEQPDRELKLPGVQVFLRNYYSVVTLYTRATHQRYTEKMAGGHRPFDSPDYFSHETTARLKPPDGPLLWASYDQRVHGRDPYLLRILQLYGRNAWGVPGLASLHPVDGDGGKARYTVGFHVEVAPWSEPSAGATKFTAGIVAMDVVAARAGIGAIAAQEGTEDGGIWCAVVGCGEREKPINLHSPPAGYGVSTPVAQLGTLSGALQLTTRGPVVVPKGAEPEGEAQLHPVAASVKLPELPREVRFGLTADLRAGLLWHDTFLGPPKDIWEINPYAQYVVRITVAMLPDTKMITGDVPILPKKSEHDLKIAVVQTWFEKVVDWVRSHQWLALLGIGLGLAVAASFAFPALGILGAVGRFLKAVIDLVTRVIQWIADRIGRKH